MSSTDGARRRARERGFTLLEVMCAFAILAGTTGFLNIVFFKALDKGTQAFHLRQLREAADTIFRRMIYEEHRFSDGDSATLDISYAEWAWNGPPPTSERVKWERYRHVLEKKSVNAAGPRDDENDSDSMFGEGGDSRSSSRSSSSREEEEEGPPGESLWRMTLRIYDVDDPGEPLLALRTYIPVRERADGSGAPR